MKEDKALRDPLLLVHRLAHGEYSIAGKYNPVSIKDQMVRATAIIDRVIFHQALTEGQRLLVVGAGAAGVTAALRATDYGIKTTIVEREKEPFVRQRGSNRIVDPTQYDWPAPHWANGTLQTPLPLALESKPARELAALWTREYYKDRPLLQRVHERDYQGSIRHEGSKSGELIALTRPWPEKPEFSTEQWAVFDMILNCSGPGKESAAIERGKFASFAFWENDTLGIEGFGLPPWSSSAKSPRVLLSGGGDGSLQDFLRIAFPKMTPTQIYRKFVSRKAWRAEIERRIFAAEDEFRRAWIWSEMPELDHQVLARLHQKHVETARWVRGEGAVLVPESAARIANVKIVHPCSHFSVCYALNHFLGVLLNESLGGGQIVEENRLTRVISGARGHTCARKASHCWQNPHKGIFEVSRCVPRPNGKGTPKRLPSQIFDLIVLRHGPVKGTPALARQILPYELPW